jgi:poly-gamma-glutamate synthesis protein (capsule biosynthesis protein)
MVPVAPVRREGTMLFAGDVLVHQAVWRRAATGSGHDFSPMLAPVKGKVEAADAAICHLEVTLALDGQSLSGFPRFRAPRSLAAGLRDAGFDGCSVASNHALDFGADGVRSTLDALDEVGLRHAGTARSVEEDAVAAVYDVGGITVAHLSYAYGFNGFVEPLDQRFLVDELDPATVLSDARAARAAGAELVVVSLHWGTEYRHEVTGAQAAVAEALAAEPGAVDLVAGTHAHVVQPISRVGSMWVVWGMGNMLSNNATRCCPRVTADGVLVTVRIADGIGPGGAPGVAGIAFTPTWNDRRSFEVLPVVQTLRAGASGTLASELLGSFERTHAHVLSLGGAELGVAPDELPADPAPAQNPP